MACLTRKSTVGVGRRVGQAGNGPARLRPQVWDLWQRKWFGMREKSFCQRFLLFSVEGEGRLGPTRPSRSRGGHLRNDVPKPSGTPRAETPLAGGFIRLKYGSGTMWEASLPGEGRGDARGRARFHPRRDQTLRRENLRAGTNGDTGGVLGLPLPAPAARGEGQSLDGRSVLRASSPRPSPPSDGGEGENAPRQEWPEHPDGGGV